MIFVAQSVTIEEGGLTPNLFIGFSDLWLNLAFTKPDFPVLWITPKKRGRAPWGEVLVVPNKT